LDAFKDFVTIKEAAEFLGVTSATLRNWDKQGKIKAYRHPLNRYRLYKKSELEKIKKQLVPRKE
jgi:excisionase family DNA binding protein